MRRAAVLGKVKLEPGVIFETINACPPLMRQKKGNTFIGKQVDWLLTFRNGSETQGQAHLMFDIAPYQVRIVTGTVSLADYPWLKSLDAGEAVRVQGRIQSIDPMSIELKVLKLRLSEVAHAH